MFRLRKELSDISSSFRFLSSCLNFTKTLDDFKISWSRLIKLSIALLNWYIFVEMPFRWHSVLVENYILWQARVSVCLTTNCLQRKGRPKINNKFIILFFRLKSSAKTSTSISLRVASTTLAIWRLQRRRLWKHFSTMSSKTTTFSCGECLARLRSLWTVLKMPWTRWLVTLFTG